MKCKIKFEVIPSSENYHIFILMTPILYIRPTHLTHDRNSDFTPEKLDIEVYYLIKYEFRIQLVPQNPTVL